MKKSDLSYKDKENELGENPDLEKEITAESELKRLFVNYVGDKYKPESGHVTVAMIIDALADEFPEFLMVVAEENWIRGYHQAMTDVEEGEATAFKKTQEAAKKTPTTAKKKTTKKAPRKKKKS